MNPTCGYPPSARIRIPTRRATLLGLCVQALLAIACTLTADDFEPAPVAGQTSAGAGDNGRVDAELEVDVASAAPCSGGHCVASCDGGCALPPRCDRDDACSLDADCASLNCSDRCCVPPSCGDAIQNQNESDVDCGGSCPAPCSAGQRCRADTDCASGKCDPSAHCASASCVDGLLNQDETDVDCGGSCPDRCGPGAACDVDVDCESRLCGDACESGAARCCQLGTCPDGAQNAGEVDVDCGGSDATCPRCAEGRTCQGDVDCSSGACEQGRCCGGLLGDCTRCAERLSATQDCSGAPEGGVVNCTAFLECLTRNASICTSRFAPGCTNDPGGVCNHNTYGGNDGLGVRHATLVLREAGCTP